VHNCVICNKPMAGGERFAHRECEESELADMARAAADVEAYDSEPHDESPGPVSDLF
jgi:hypothetical protein